MVILAMSFGSIATGYSGSIIGSILAQDSFYVYFDLTTRPDATSLILAMNGLFQGVQDVNQFHPSIHRAWAPSGFWLLGSIPVWMTEIVLPRIRRLLVDIHSAALLFGYATIDAWRGPLALQCLPALIVVSVMPWLPESPRWLIQKGKHDDARRVLSKLHHHEEAHIEFVQIEFTGVLVINSMKTSYSSFTPALTRSHACGIITMFIIDLFPRNVLVVLGTPMVTSCLTVETALVANFPVGPGQNNDALRAAAAMTFCYIAFAQLFLDGTQYVYYAELFPNHIRAKGMTFGMASISLMNVMWLQVALTAFEKITWKFYLCFISPAYFFAIAWFFFYPNTKGMAPEEIAVPFGDEVETDVYRAHVESHSSDKATCQLRAREVPKRDVSKFASSAFERVPAAEVALAISLAGKARYHHLCGSYTE
ncbi:hypothetical protein K458DRAFT_440000 [Lentithecium fluviatile CBS 122367]|uniref:MFS general substrate transporter n=1 Tax=Lentithecium fluviatile CBS 122367 TaxID=1168545 RepID=A0A6G1JCW2_9PLEO|nr:hypothetical protein K458DRAFT_440000 [Lentithecium fluviatile CBS 122367]